MLSLFVLLNKVLNLLHSNWHKVIDVDSEHVIVGHLGAVGLLDHRHDAAELADVVSLVLGVEHPNLEVVDLP